MYYTAPGAAGVAPPRAETLPPIRYCILLGALTDRTLVVLNMQWSDGTAIITLNLSGAKLEAYRTGFRHVLLQETRGVCINLRAP